MVRICDDCGCDYDGKGSGFYLGRYVCIPCSILNMGPAIDAMYEKNPEWRTEWQTVKKNK